MHILEIAYFEPPLLGVVTELLIDSPPSPDILCLDTLCEEEEESTKSENEAELDSHTGLQQDDSNSHDWE